MEINANRLDENFDGFNICYELKIFRHDGLNLCCLNFLVLYRSLELEFKYVILSPVAVQLPISAWTGRP